MQHLKLKPIVVTIALSTLTNIATAELRTERAVVPNDETHRVAASSYFASTVQGDLYIAAQINGQLLFFAEGGTEVSSDAIPYIQDGVYLGEIPLFDISAAGITPGQYPIYQLITASGSNPYDFRNWVGGPAGISSINFTIGLPSELSGDLDDDGFADDDSDRDGFFDDDLDKDGFHDDDHDRDGLSDDDDANDSDDDDVVSVTSTVSANIAVGRDLYQNCSNSSCHGADPQRNQNDILDAINPAETRSAINRNKGGMGFLNFLTDVELQAISEFVRNP